MHTTKTTDMSEYTVVYLRKKGDPLLTYREHLTYEERLSKSEEEIIAAEKEVNEYNNGVSKSYGCELFYLCTTPSRRLTVLRWTEDPKPLSRELLDEVLSFYEEEINSWEKTIANIKEQITVLEQRILKANVNLYDKISEDIAYRKDSIRECEEYLDEDRSLQSKFRFLHGIITNDENMDTYELVYTKC